MNKIFRYTFVHITAWRTFDGMEIKSVKIRDAELTGEAAEVFLDRFGKEVAKDGNPKKKGIVLNMLLKELSGFLKNKKQ